ncbi:MAG: CCA tRNA nucleotidyltransferase [Acidobacteriota bacterium]|nr:CCA tRNA nucleotidyltransferase [Acidobacteriota bacterium]
MNQQALAKSIVQRLRQAGFVAFLTGGCVRDLLMGRAPADFDVTTSARPEELLELFPRAGRVGAHFGVVLVHEGEADVEVATFRSDLEYRDGRRPEGVHFETDPRQDVLRRDFTINALLLDPLSGQILDFVGGRKDLEAKLIRAIGDPDLRFREDHLRLLRAIRFAARFGFSIERNTSDAVQRHSQSIESVSAERVRDEISRILTEGGARRGFELLDSTGLLGHVLPEVAKMKGVAQPPQFHPEGDVWTHTLLMLEGLREPSLTLALGVLLHDVGKPDTFRIAERIRFDGHVAKGIEIAHSLLTRLRFPNHVIEGAEALIANHMKFMEVPRMRESTLKRFMRLPDFEEHMQLHRLDCLSSHGGLENYDFIRVKQLEVTPEQLKPPPLITGRELIAAGYRPGPMFGVVLAEIEDAQLEGRIATAEEALHMARARLH